MLDGVTCENSLLLMYRRCINLTQQIGCPGIQHAVGIRRIHPPLFVFSVSLGLLGLTFFVELKTAETCNWALCSSCA